MKDSIVESVVNQFKQRSEIGIKKYNTTLDRTDLNRLDWIQHAQEEAMDLILYLERLKKELDKKIEVREEIIIYAFRYCLGRKTYAVKDCVDTIINNWHNLSERAKVLFVKEISEHKKQWGDLGMDMDKEQWYRIVNKND